MNDPGTTTPLDYAPDSSPRYNTCAVASLLCALAALLPIPGAWLVMLFDLKVPRSLAIAVMAMAPLGGLVTLILSLFALGQIDKHPARYRGKLIAMGAMTFGLLFSLSSAGILWNWLMHR